MENQRVGIICYFLVALSIFYAIYVKNLLNVSQPLPLAAIKELETNKPELPVFTCNIRHGKDVPLHSLAKQLENLIAQQNVLVKLSPLESDNISKEDKQVTFDDLVNVFTPFEIALVYDSKLKDNFNVNIKGGKSIVISVGNAPKVEPIFDLVYGAFFKPLVLDSTHMTPELELNFILLSDDALVSWDLKGDFIKPYLDVVINSLTPFYSIHVRSRVLSGVEWTKHSNISDGKCDIRAQDVNFFHFLETISTNQVYLRDTHAYVHSLAFVVIVPNREVHFIDEHGQPSDSVYMRNVGVISLLNAASKTKENQAYHLTRSDAEHLVATWITYIRQLHKLPTCLKHMVANLYKAKDTLVESNTPIGDKEQQLTVRFNGAVTKMTFEPPAAVGLYGFEQSRIASALYKIYRDGTLQNLAKIRATAKIHWKQKTLAHYTSEAVAKLAHDKTTVGARDAYRLTLEALGNDANYPENLTSNEHSIATLMCDAFPFLVPPLVSTLNKLTS